MPSEHVHSAPQFFDKWVKIDVSEIAGANTAGFSTARLQGPVAEYIGADCRSWWRSEIAGPTGHGRTPGDAGLVRPISQIAVCGGASRYKPLCEIDCRF